VRTLALLGLLALGMSVMAGCKGQGEVSQQDAANFSKTPDGKDDGGLQQLNNNR